MKAFIPLDLHTKQDRRTAGRIVFYICLLISEQAELVCMSNIYANVF